VSLVVWSGVWFVQRLRANSQIAHVKQLQQQLADATDTQRRELWGQMRQAMEELPESARRGLWQERRAEFEQRMDDRMKKVLLLPSDQRAAEIDKQIDEMEERRKQWEQRRQQQAAGNGAPGQNQNGGRQRGQGRQRPNDPTGKVAMERTKRRLDNSTPEQRALRDEYRRLLDTRRQQRGMPPSAWPR
jgi:hypothetical protein